MLETIIITIIICFIVFELIEHVFIPLFFFILRGKKKSNYGVMGMIGKVVEIKRWNKTEGQVLVNGELWNAVCEISLQEGSKAVILGISNAKLYVS
ncbi:MAG: NfeD family protein [Deltaproteobacteria bacterium]|nr:NfeD family protein [Deltaproteobacteria bacterium]